MPAPASASEPVRQDRFDGGEVSEEQYGRIDDPRYRKSLRTCLNFIPLQHGALVNRPGTIKIALTGGGGSRPRLERFVFSNDDAVLLEFGNFYIRFYVNGARLETAPGVALETATAYPLAAVMDLDMAQSGDVVTITHPDYAIYSLTRLAAMSWVVALEPFGPPAGFIPQSLDADCAADNADAYDNGRLYIPGEYANDGTNTFIAVLTTIANPPQAWDGDHPWWEIALDPTKIPRAWEVVITALYKDSLGRRLESLPSAKKGMTAFIDETRPAHYSWTAPADPGFGWKSLGYRVYRGRNGLYGWLADTGVGVIKFDDDGKEPNYAIQPPKSTQPFKVADGNNTDATIVWPAAVAYHEGRRVYGLLNRFVASKLDNFDNFDTNFPLQDTDSYDFKVSSQKFEKMRHMVSLHKLLLFTSEAEYVAEAPPGQAITPLAIRAPRHSDHGSSGLRPVVVGNAAIFNTAKGNYVRDFQFNFANGAFSGADLTTRARHLFDEHTLVDWDFQEVPFPVLWGARDDGVLLSCTYQPETQTLAWARHTLGGGALAKRVRCLPEALEDVVYLDVDRFGSNYIEKMASRHVSDIRTCVFLDSSVTYNGYPEPLGLFGQTMLIDSVDVPGSNAPANYVAGKQVVVEASAAAFAAGDVGTRVMVFDPGTDAMFSASIVGYTNTTHVTAELLDDLTQADIDIWAAGGAFEWAIARTVVTGLDHLNGSDVKVLADAAVRGPFTVAAGAAGPFDPAIITVAGVPYNSDAELLDVAAPSLKQHVKDVVKVILEVVSSRGFWTGKDFSHLREWLQKLPSNSWGPPPAVTDQVEVVIDSAWDKSGRVVIRQVDPLPLTIVAATREVVLGGK